MQGVDLTCFSGKPECLGALDNLAALLRLRYGSIPLCAGRYKGIA